MSSATTLAVVGAVGGAGTTRSCLELGATLARAGERVAVLDAAFATQGLADYVDGPVDPDLTQVLTDDRDLETAACRLPLDVSGDLALYPVRAPFERLARAKTAGAAERFETLVATAALSHDAVLVDVPPVAANQAVAAVNACERTAVVAPDTARGADGLARTQDRLADFGVDVDAVISTFAESDRLDADAAIPPAEVTTPRACPSCVEPVEIAPHVARAAEATLERDLELEFEQPGRLSRVFGDA